MTIYNNILYNLNEADIDKPIYRIITIERLSELFDKRQLIFPQVKVWEDVYENFLLKSNFTDSDDSDFQIDDDFEEYYGQCWTLSRDSDALWRIYSTDKRSVRIKTTIRKLLNLIVDIFSNGSKSGIIADRKIGSVSYKTQEELERWANNQQVTRSNLQPFMEESLFIKRSAFEHEKEIRILYFADSVSDPKLIPNKKLVGFEIENPVNFIEEIAFDPRVEEPYLSAYKNSIVKRYLYPAERIIKSDLYSSIVFRFCFKN